jgi:hypothetical protein
MQRSDFPNPRTVRNGTADAPARITRQVKRTAVRAERRNVAAAIAAALAELHAFDGETIDHRPTRTADR